MKRNTKHRTLAVVLILVLIMSLIPVTQVSAAGSATGTQIVNKAMEYLGKVPYVWGGTKIDGSNPGADCSGFICRIYEKFGFKTVSGEYMEAGIVHQTMELMGTTLDYE